MKPLKVLSIDWDYLVNATTAQRMRLFPDGGSETLPVMFRILFGHQDMERVKN